MRKILPILFVLIAFQSLAQQISAVKIEGTQVGKPLTAFLSDVERNHHIKVFVNKTWLQNISVSRNVEGLSLTDALEKILEGTDLNFVEMYPGVLVIVKDPKQALSRRVALETAARENKKVTQFTFGTAGNSTTNQVTIRGKVIEFKTNEPLANANIKIHDTAAGTTTDASGNFSLTLTPGLHVLNVSYIDFESRVIDLAAYADGDIIIEMDKNALILDEIVVQDQAEREITTSRIGQIQFTMRDLKRAPALMGEADLIKQIQTLPGVTTVGEAATGFNVRGGSVDQNLVLYDGLPVYNTAHALGFLSAFNSEAVRDVSFYRGGIPAEYGGRVSSVLDIHSRDGSFEKWNGNAGIGLITSNLMVNGPLKKDKTSLMTSFRTTYSDYLVRAIRTDYADLRNSSVFFYDGALKLNHTISSRSKIAASMYSSKDSFSLFGDTTYHWQNFQTAVKFNNQFSSALNGEFATGISSYKYRVDNADPLSSSELSYKITTTSLSGRLNYEKDNHSLAAGWQMLYYIFNPGRLRPTSPTSSAKDYAMPTQYSLENAFYVSDNWAVRDDLGIEAGIRLPIFTSFGPASVYTYEENTPREVNTVTDTLHFRGFQNIKTYAGFEPRLSFRWNVTSLSSFKLGYNRIYQFLHLVTNTTAVTPVDIWQPSGYYFKPQRADQISFGYFTNSRNKKYNTSAEVFYKDIQNIIDFKDGAQLLLNPQLETDLLQGRGYAYGIETYVSKNTGRLTGTINYTYSRSFRVIAGATDAESINQGNRYPTNYDQPHVANLSWKYSLSRRHYFTGNFTYHTGRPVTIPISVFEFENTTLAYFSQRNQYRIPDYHRLDLALIIEGNHKRNRNWKGTWAFSVYNVYGRKNPYTIFFKGSATGVPVPYQLAIIGVPFPSISYNVKF